jgi:UDP-3-O-[3-hydroxymyristoyl] glucosamine N-acyltransferase LpxD
MRKIHPSAVVYPNVKLGKNVAIGANSVIGGEGFGFDRNQNFVYLRIPHIGGTIIGDNVEIGACTCVDRAQTKDFTTIGKGTKVDNLIHVAHNVRIGENCALAAGVILGGSVVLGDRVFVGINATIKPEVKVGDDAMIAMGAVVIKDVAKGEIVAGNPAKFLRIRDYLEKRAR